MSDPNASVEAHSKNFRAGKLQINWQPGLYLIRLNSIRRQSIRKLIVYRRFS